MLEYDSSESIFLFLTVRRMLLFFSSNGVFRAAGDKQKTYRPAWNVNLPVAFAAAIFWIISGTVFFVDFAMFDVIVDEAVGLSAISMWCVALNEMKLIQTFFYLGKSTPIINGRLAACGR